MAARPSLRVSRRSPTASRAGAPASSCCAATGRCTTSCRGRRRAPSRARHIDAGELADRRPRDAAERYVKAFARYLRRQARELRARGVRARRDVRRAGADRRSSARSRTRSRACSGASASPTASSRRAPGGPRAPRAAGAFCARCPLDLLLPAHRVVRADGSLGEYGAHGVALQAAAARARGLAREPAPPAAHRLPRRRHRPLDAAARAQARRARRSRRSSR